MKTHKKLIAVSMVAAVSMTSPGMQVAHAEGPKTETVRMKETAYFLKDAEIYLDKTLKTKAGMAEKYATVTQTGASPEADEIEYEGKNYYVDSTALTTDVNYLDTAEKNYQAKEKAEADAEDRELAERKVEAWKNYLNTLKQDAETQKDATAMGEIDKELSEIADSVDAIAKEKDTDEDSTAPAYTEDYTEATASTQKIWNYLTDHGFTEIEAAGIMGNIQGECDFNPRATDGGLGLFQWIGGRAKNYIAYAGKENMWDAETQLSYMIHELNTTEHKAYTAIHRASTPAQAAYLWDRMFERSAGLSTTKRMEWATYWYSKYATGKDTASVLKESASYAISPSQLKANKEFAKSYIQSHNRTKEETKEKTKRKTVKTEEKENTKTESKEKENKKTETREKKNVVSSKEKGQKSVTEAKKKGQKNVNSSDKKGKKNVTASEEKEKKNEKTKEKTAQKRADDKAKEKTAEKRKEKETQKKETQNNAVQKKAEEKEMQNNVVENKTEQNETQSNAGQNAVQSNVNENKAEEKTAQSNAEGNANAVEKEEESNVEEENKAETESNTEEKGEEKQEEKQVGTETETETKQGDVADTADQLG